MRGAQRGACWRERNLLGGILLLKLMLLGLAMFFQFFCEVCVKNGERERERERWGLEI